MCLNQKFRSVSQEKWLNHCVLPVMTYGAETITLIRWSTEKLQNAERAMERSMLGLP